MDKQGSSVGLASRFLPDCPQWWIVIWKQKASKSFPPKAALGHTVSSQHQKSKLEHPGKLSALAEVLKHQTCETGEDGES